MKLKKPTASAVRIKISNGNRSSKQKSINLTVYDATIKEVSDLIRKAIKEQ